MVHFNNNINSKHIKNMSKRFRGFYPIVVDVETGGLNPLTDALLEIAVLPIEMQEDGSLTSGELKHYHIEPFDGANISKESLEINQIDPTHPFRFAVAELIALQELFDYIENIRKKANCLRCVLVGHNSWFDLHFLNAATKRCNLKSPFHSFTSLDTATLSAIFYGQTALAQAARRAQISFDPKEHHSAIYDAQKTAELFCKIANSWLKFSKL
jgi:ribonuclease T